MRSKVFAFPHLLLQKSNFSLIVLHLLVRCVCTSLVSELNKSAEYLQNGSESINLQNGGKSEYLQNGGESDSYFSVQYFNDTQPPCEVLLPSSTGTAGSGVLYSHVHKKLVLCNIVYNNTTNRKIPDLDVEIMSLVNCSLDHLDIGSVLLHLNIYTGAIYTLNITGCNLTGAKFTSSNLPTLKVLDLRGNGLTGLNEPRSLQGLHKIYLSDNDWSCISPGSGVGKWSLSNLDYGRKLSWLVEDRFYRIWQDKDKTECSFHKGKRWYTNEYDPALMELEKRKPRNLLIQFIQFSRDTLERCPPGCDCELAKPLANELIPYDKFRASILCSYLNLKELPSTIPDKTIFIDVSNNDISSLFPLIGPSSPYRYLTKINLANNSIHSMEGLRDSWLMKNSPTEVDLRENKMALFDTTILETMMNEQSTKMTKVEEGFYFLFSKNPWRCGCKRIKHIQEFLAKYQFLLKDGDEMECSNLPVRVINFNFKTECEPADHHQLMTWIVIIECILVVLVLGKLCYDIVVYRRTGHLPWIARNLCGINTHGLQGLPRFSMKKMFSGEGGLQERGSSWTGLTSRTLQRRGSSGYMTASVASSNIAQSKQEARYSGVPGPEIAPAASVSFV